jgi:hypothetical protein
LHFQRHTGITGQETEPQSLTKTCPFCAEEIKTAAKKCKHCGETLGITEPDVGQSFEGGTAGLLIRSFNTKGVLNVPDDVPGFFADEAVCQVKFKLAGTFILVAGPVLTRSDGRTFFIDGEFGANTVTGDNGDSFQADVEFFHQNWTGIPLLVRAFQSQNEVPICRWQCESRIMYLGMHDGSHATGLYKAKIRPVLENGIDAQYGDWVDIDKTTQVRWRQAENKHMTAGVEVNTSDVALVDPECPLPTITKIWCTKSGGLIEGPEFWSEWSVDEEHPNVIEVDGEFRLRELDIISGE